MKEKNKTMKIRKALDNNCKIMSPVCICQLLLKIPEAVIILKVHFSESGTVPRGSLIVFSGNQITGTFKSTLSKTPVGN